MDLNFTEEQLMLQDAARRIAQDVIAPSAEHFDRSGEFPLDNIRLLGESGLMGIEVPAEYGGAGMDPVAYVLAVVEIAAGDAAHSTIMSVNNSLFCAGILKHGSEAQKQLYVRAVAEGRQIGAFDGPAIGIVGIAYNQEPLTDDEIAQVLSALIAGRAFAPVR